MEPSEGTYNEEHTQLLASEVSATSKSSCYSGDLSVFDLLFTTSGFTPATVAMICLMVGLVLSSSFDTVFLVRCSASVYSQVDVYLLYLSYP